MKRIKRNKGDNMVLFILIVIIIAVALLVGASYGYELGVKKCNSHYSGYIRNNCMCHSSINIYETERFIPITMLNLSTS